MTTGTHFEIYTDTEGFWRWRLVAGNGRIVADSGEGYDNLSNVERAVSDLEAWVKVATTNATDYVA